MFYSQFILAKKGPLGTIWIAAHLERKLRKNQVADTDIGVSVDSILFPEMPIALRLSSHLLLGVVRIYSRKVNYLFDDCSEALLKVKQAFRSAAVDLPPEESTAPYHSITLPETFDLDDFELPDNEIFQGNYVDHHISSKDQITLQDTMEGVVYSTSKFGLDERFGDGDASGLDLEEELLAEKAATAEHATGTSNSDVDPQAPVQTNESLKYDDNQDAVIVPEAMPAGGIVNQHLEEYDGDSEPVEYAQAPCTPGLWEEPNLSNVQETSACDDHHETENHIITESAVKENLENECIQHEQHHNQFEPLDKSPPHIVATEQMMDDIGSTHYTEPPVVSETITAVSNDPSKVEDLLNKNTLNEEPAVQTVNDNHENRVEHQGNQENAGHATTELESDVPSLRPCVTLLNHEISGEKDKLADSLQPSEITFLPSLETESMQGEGQHATEALETNLPDMNLDEAQVENVVEKDIQVDNINSYTNDFPAPEKLLSLPQGFSDVTNDFVPENTPIEKDITTGDMILGKKRGFTESSMTAQSLNLNESSGLFSTNISKESVMDDDDLLSSILVGRRSSILKMKPTPPREAPSTKRRRSAPKTGILKRKVVMDDNMVLHGDTIRQQLTNTEDIRRLRKKAPCSHSEISMLKKQFLEDELFNEPIFTGVSIKLASLHDHSYDLSKIVVYRCDASLEGETNPKLVSHNDDKDMQMEVAAENMDVSVGPNILKENAGEDNFEAQPIGFPLVTDNHTFDNNTTDLDYNGSHSQEQMHATGDVIEAFNLEHDLFGQGTAMEIDIGAPVIPIEAESLTHVNVAPQDTCQMSASLGEVENTSQMDTTLPTDAPGVHSNEKMDLQSVRMDPFMNIISSNKSIENSIASEIKEDEEKHDRDIEITKNQEDAVNNDAQNLVVNVNGIYGEEFEAVAAYDNNTEINPNLEDVPLDERENPGHQVTSPMTAMNAQDIPDNNMVDDDELTYSAVGNDTDFLNFDDVDDDDEAGDDYMPNTEATQVIDNSGWSSRTKAVAKYLQVMFDKEGARGKNMLPVNNLLAGKTRKEASRMFFETLVLKTKDYIHVEQADPFENINIFPRAKLLKSDF